MVSAADRFRVTLDSQLSWDTEGHPQERQTRVMMTLAESWGRGRRSCNEVMASNK